jgi:hypothetical protein
MIGAERAMAARVLCEPFSAHKAYYIGVITDVAGVESGRQVHRQSVGGTADD